MLININILDIAQPKVSKTILVLMFYTVTLI